MVVPRSHGGEMAAKDSFLTRLRTALTKEGYDLSAKAGRKRPGEPSLAELARTIDYDGASMTRLVKGERMDTIKTIETAARLARALKTTVEALVFGDAAAAEPKDDADSSGVRPARKQSHR